MNTTTTELEHIQSEINALKTALESLEDSFSKLRTSNEMNVNKVSVSLIQSPIIEVL